jgi:hypothetical protein
MIGCAQSESCGRAAAFAACTADDSRSHDTHGTAAGRIRVSQVIRQAAGRARTRRILEIDTIADRRAHFTLRRAFHFETTNVTVCVGTTGESGGMAVCSFNRKPKASSIDDAAQRQRRREEG